MEEESTFLGIDLDVWNNMPVMKQIEAIEKSTSNTDQTMKMILEELQKVEEVQEEVIEEVPEIPVEEAVPTSEIPAEETEVPAKEAETPLAIDEPKVEEVPVEEVPVEEVPVEEAEEPIDYMKMIFEELQTQHEIEVENQQAIVVQLETIQEQGLKSNEVDGMAGLYMMYLIPLAVVVSMGSKVLSPFLRG